MMAGSNLSANRASEVNSEMPKLEAEVRGLTSHIEFLLSSSASVDACAMLEQHDKILSGTVRLRSSAATVSRKASSIERRQLGDRYGQFMGNYNAIAGRVEKEISRLDDALLRLRIKSFEKIQDPRRWGGEEYDGVADTMQEIIRLTNDAMLLLKSYLNKIKSGQ
jgi:hypothetical protein